jgi:exonuclease 3'-5' domain-containing protein 1
MPPVTFISTSEDLASMLAALEDLPTSPPSLYIDLEGAKLSRNGTIALLTLYVPPKETVYLVDIHTMGARAFSTPATAATAPVTTLNAEGLTKDTEDHVVTLKYILESPTIPKVFFDVRNDSDALFSHYGIKLFCIHDLQLMELATTTRGSREYLVGLSKTIEYNASRLSITPTQTLVWKTTKETGVKLFAPEHGGHYRVFEDRPLSEAIKNYCTQDVVYMPRLWTMYNERMAQAGMWQVMALEGAARRVQESQQVGYRPNGPHKKYGCWNSQQIKEARRRWDGGQRKNLCG